MFCSVGLGCRYTPYTMDRVVSWASFLTGGVFECDVPHRRSVARLCMLYKIRYDPMHPLYGAMPGPFVPTSTGYTRCFGRTSVHVCSSSLQTFIWLLFPCQYLCGSTLVTLFDGMGRGFKSRANAILLD